MISLDNGKGGQPSNGVGKWGSKNDNNNAETVAEAIDTPDNGSPVVCVKHKVPKGRCTHCQDKRFWHNRAGGTAV